MAQTHAQAAVADPLIVLTIDPAVSTPPSRQLHDAVVAAIASGALSPGQQLPTVRALATHLGIAVNTVASAYKQLEAAHLVEGRGRAGTFIALGDDPVEAEARRIALDTATRLQALGLTAQRAQTLCTEAIATTANRPAPN